MSLMGRAVQIEFESENVDNFHCISRGLEIALNNVDVAAVGACDFR